MPDQRPVLVYDADCGFCVYWARYWRKLTGDTVDYRPYQEVAAQYPSISLDDFRRAVQYIAPDGQVASGADASFRTLSHARGKGVGLTLYRRLPGFAALSELIYAFIAAHRSAFSSHQSHSLGQRFWAAALRSGRVSVSAPVWTHLLIRIRLLRSAGARADRQPRHLAAGGTGGSDQQPGRYGALLSHADAVLVERQRPRPFKRSVGPAPGCLCSWS